MSPGWLAIPRTAAVALTLAVAGSAQAADAILTPAQMREDLTFLKEKWAPLDKSFSDSQRVAFGRHLDETASAAEDLEPEEFALEVMKAVAIARNGHTNANVGTLLGADLPVRVWSFSDGLYIVKTHPDFEWLLGARIDGIGSLTTQEALDRVRAYLPGTDQRIRFLSPGYLVAPAVLEQIGAVDGTDHVPLTLQFDDGRTEIVELAPTKGEDPGDERKASLNRGYSVLVPDDPDLPGRWRHLLDGRKELPPIYGKRSDVQARFLDDSKKVLYIRNDTARSIDETPLPDKFAGIILDKILPMQPKHIIVDLRLNNGGDFFNTILFSRAIPRLVPRDGRVFVLVGRATFSAGITTAAMLKGEGGDKVTLIGEPMGDGGQFWSEGKYVKLPNSQIAVRYSHQFHDYETGCFDVDDCYWATVAFGPRGISIAPETTVELSFRAYAQGRDPVQEKVLDLAGRH
ncbi:S41 family peptidase [Rhizobium laguerreae]|uniref:peptidase S41 n=1 Tax=Rhizobium laguerreae TaxID=1076926 RepID=UPI001C907BC3|nr:peptidase S41 [Rhizobium laguerreae]MBY3212537.1 peptidase S41 [Rhizobium laguerreae]MBY3214240.1 peptidase S41 [Rhizobium laguerreae]MBY3232334.1 peptidase S41 [Rhizobium laguerreae]